MHALSRQLNKWGGEREEALLLWNANKRRDAAPRAACLLRYALGTYRWNGPPNRAPKKSIYLSHLF